MTVLVVVGLIVGYAGLVLAGCAAVYALAVVVDDHGHRVVPNDPDARAVIAEAEQIVRAADREAAAHSRREHPSTRRRR